MSKKTLIINDFFGGEGGSSVVAKERFVQQKGCKEFVCWAARENFVDSDFSRVMSFFKEPKRPWLGLNILGIFNPFSLFYFTFFALSRFRSKSEYLIYIDSVVKRISIISCLPLLLIKKKTIYIVNHDFFYICPSGLFFNFSTSKVCKFRIGSSGCFGENCDRNGRFFFLFKYLRFALNSWIVRLFLRSNSVSFVFVSNKARDYSMQSIPQFAKVRVLENRLRSGVSIPAKRISCENNRRVLFVGRDGLEKGVDLVIDVAKFSGFDFDIIGCNQLEGRSLPPNVRNHGPLIWSDIEILLKGARCLIFPSRTIEADGLVLREVGVFGVPAIISNSVLKANELFASGSSLLFEVGSVMSLWTQLSRLEDDEVVRGLSQSTWEAYSDIRHKDEPS